MIRETDGRSVRSIRKAGTIISAANVSSVARSFCMCFRAAAKQWHISGNTAKQWNISGVRMPLYLRGYMRTDSKKTGIVRSFQIVQKVYRKYTTFLYARAREKREKYRNQTREKALCAREGETKAEGKQRKSGGFYARARDQITVPSGNLKDIEKSAPSAAAIFSNSADVNFPTFKRWWRFCGVVSIRLASSDSEMPANVHASLIFCSMVMISPPAVS